MMVDRAARQRREHRAGGGDAGFALGVGEMQNRIGVGDV